MNPEFDEVLLTAYLDDEVTDAERASVEAELQSSEATRKLLEELRTIRNQVAKLALLQPNRNLKNGPWNATNDSPFVELSSTAADGSDATNWKVIYQRLASLAAMIAIAACVSLLWMKPNTIPIGQSEGRKQAEANPSDGTKSRERIEIAERKEENLGRVAVDPAAKATLDLEPQSSNSERDASLSISDRKKSMMEAENMPRAAPSMKRSVESLSLQTDRDEFGAGGLSGATSLESLSSASTEQVDPVLTKILDAYASARDPTKLKDISIEGFKLVESMPEAENKSASTKQMSAHIAWSFQSRKASDKESVQDMDAAVLAMDTAALSKDAADGPVRAAGVLPPAESTKPSGSQTTNFLGRELRTAKAKTADKSSDSGTLAMVVEFRIPSEEWAAGARRLRQLGVQVPLELPNEEVLEFSAMRSEASLAAEAMAAGSSPAAIAPLKPELKSDLNTTSKSESQMPAQTGFADSGSLGLGQYSFQPLAATSIGDNAAGRKRGGEQEQPFVKVLIRLK